ncbi:hypothetical protein TRFO_12058 [Tritrichomonas foetus]|uniref:Cullin family profile domain-containing protein n=1 Tax=Tritrichomonas foetus TaxID=1144522 RepID=A0A1J4J2T4_9EUKA|nr:hypothetical protein TRFO_12058 [Tritrichomonas foetus]|eukprot:OHS93049.1 hypothetical protein TRFO_12058 [Tritrichomonas foetus]
MPRQPIRKQDVDGWEIVKSGLLDILRRQQSQLKLTNLHEAVGILVSSSKSEVLRKGLYEILKEHFVGWRTELSHIAGNPLITRFSSIYDDFQTYCSIIPKIYNLYDRRNDAVHENETLTLICQLFQELVLYDVKLMNDTTSGILKDILSSRSRVDVDLKKINNLVNMYSYFSNSLDTFDIFIEKLRDDTNKYYDEFFKAKFEGTSFPNYLQVASEQFSHEEKILNEIFMSKEDKRDIENDKKKNQHREILSTCLNNILISHEDKFLIGSEPAVSIALTNPDRRPLKWLVDAYKEFNTDLERVYGACALFIENEMLKLSANFQENMKINDITRNIGELIELAENLTKPFHLIFGEVPKANEVAEEHIKKAWNDERFNIVENFCTYIDTQIKSEFKNMSPEENERFPQTIARFYTRIEDKKLFGKTYETNMVRRFIKMGIKLADIEGPIINSIRRAKAPDFAKGFKDYIKKIHDSQELENSFKEEMQHLTESGTLNSKIAFSPLIFDQRMFPLDRTEARYLPPQLDPIHKAFVSFYMKKHPMTKLMLIQDVSTVESKFHVPRNAKSAHDRTYTVSSDIICASVIQAVSEKPLTFREIYELIAERTLIGLYLKRLCGPNCPILKREAKDKKMSDDDKFMLNPGFYFQASRVVVQPVQNERKKDLPKIKESVDVDKSQSVRAAIVRVLKMKNKVPQGQLENDVVQMMMQFFKADVALIRRMLQELEAEDYFHKEEENGQVSLVYHQ